MPEIAIILFLVVVAPIWIIAHYVTRWRTAKVLSGDDQRRLAELREAAAKMESRINTLEQILDSDVPDWRRRT